MATTEASQAALRLHPIQYAIITGPGHPMGGSVRYNTEAKPDAEFSASLPPGLAAGIRVERFNRCPNCEQWSPCDKRVQLLRGTSG